MTKTQTGTFRHGMFGFPVNVTLSDEEAIPLDGLTTLNLKMKRPTESTYEINRDLDLPGSVLDEDAGIIQWVVIDGELPIIGIYKFTLTLDFTPPRRLIVDGTMKVS